MRMCDVCSFGVKAVVLALACAVIGCGGGGGGRSSRLVSSGAGSGSGTSGGQAPSQLVAMPLSTSSVELRWKDNSADEDGFRVERQDKSAVAWQTVGRVAADITKFTDTQLSPATQYSYRVVAFRGNTDIGVSNVASVTTPGCTPWSQVTSRTPDDLARGVAFDPASQTVYVVGTTTGTLGAQSFGGRDGYLQAYDAGGVLMWTEQFGTSSDDWATAVAVDANGDVFVAGYSEGPLVGQNQGGRDAFVLRFPASGGGPTWKGAFGTNRDDHVAAVAVQPSGKVVVGGTSRNIGVGNEQDPWAVQFDPSSGQSAPTWTWQSGNGFFNENLVDLAVDPMSGDVYAIGRTQVTMPNLVGTAPNQGNGYAVGDIYVAKLDAAGKEQWIVQIGSGCGAGSQSAFQGTGGDIPGGVAVGLTGEIYVTGFAQGEAAGPGSYLGPDANTQRPPSQLCNAQDWSIWGDAVLFQLDDTGAVQWVRQFGSDKSDWARDVSVAGGKVYVAGVTKGDVSGNNTGNAGGIDRFVAAFSATGTLEWIRQSGTVDDDWAYSMTADGMGGIYIAETGGQSPNQTPHVERVCD